MHILAFVLQYPVLHIQCVHGYNIQYNFCQENVAKTTINFQRTYQNLLRKGARPKAEKN